MKSPRKVQYTEKHAECAFLLVRHVVEHSRGASAVVLSSDLLREFEALYEALFGSLPEIDRGKMH